MRYSVSIQEDGGEFVASCHELGLSSSGLSRENALDSLKKSIYYNLEWCPCSSLHDGDLEFDIQM